MLIDDLEIFIITFNREKYLKHTLETILNNNSPIKDFDIKVLDNNSTDGTGTLLENISAKYKNVKHIKNNRNIGLSGNLCKAMELASKKYFWILCDNDDIDFSAWKEIEDGINQDYDVLMTCVDYNCDENKDKKAFILAQATFTPSCIYKTEFLTDDLMTYAMADNPTILPHVCVACKAINKNAKVLIPSKSIVSLTSNIIIEDHKNYNFDRVETKEKDKLTHERTKSYNFPCGIVSSFDSCKDNSVRKNAIRILSNSNLCNGYGPFINPVDIIYSSFKHHEMPLYMLIEFLMKIPEDMRTPALWLYLSPIHFYKRINKLYVRLFWILKIKLWTF